MHSIYFKDEGSGHPLVFLHGFCDTHELWSEFTRPFTQSYRVLTPDLPGFGKSGGLTAPFTIDQVGDRLAEWMVELHLEAPVIVGHSLGGYVAMSLLERHPDLLGGIVLFHSTPYADPPERKQVRNKVIAFVNENGVAPFVDTFVPGLFADKNHPAMASAYARSSQTSPESLVAYAAAMRDRPDRSAWVSSTNVPVLVMGGVNDALIRMEDLRELAKKAPKMRLFELAKSAHMGMFEAKNQAQNILSSYAQEVWPIKGT